MISEFKFDSIEDGKIVVGVDERGKTFIGKKEIDVVEDVFELKDIFTENGKMFIIDSYLSSFVSCTKEGKRKKFSLSPEVIVSAYEIDYYKEMFPDEVIDFVREQYVKSTSVEDINIKIDE